MTEDEVWNAAIEAAAALAYRVCKNDIYVKEVGLEKRCAAEIRKLKRRAAALEAEAAKKKGRGK